MRVDHEAPLVGQLNPTVVVQHPVARTAIAMQEHDQWRRSGQAIWNVNPVQTIKAIVREGDALRQCSGGRKETSHDCQDSHPQTVSG